MATLVLEGGTLAPGVYPPSCLEMLFPLAASHTGDVRQWSWFCVAHRIKSVLRRVHFGYLACPTYLIDLIESIVSMLTVYRFKDLRVRRKAPLRIILCT